jgi:MSHA biogenesis protein MshI
VAEFQSRLWTALGRLGWGMGRSQAEPETTTCVAQDAGRLVLVQSMRVNDRPVVMHCRTQPLSAGVDSAALQQLAAGLAVNTTRWVLLLPQDTYRVQLTELPQVPQSELRQALVWRLAELFADHTDAAVPTDANFSFDCLPLPAVQAGAAASQGLVFGLPHATLAPLQLAFHGARLPLSVVTVPELAQRDLSARLEPDARGQAVLSFGAQGGLLTVTQGGRLYMSRHLDTSLAQITQSDAYTRGMLFERVALEVQRSLDVFDRQYHALGLSRLLLAPLPDAHDAVHTLSQNLFLPVEVFDLTQAMDVPPEHQQDPGLWLALGASLRPPSVPEDAP